MKKIHELFDIRNGLSSSFVNLSESKNDFFSIPYIRPSSNYYNLVAGYVNIEEVSEKYVFPSDSIFVSTDGQGSHSYAYVSPFQFVPNSNVCVLIPRIMLTLNEKIFYAMAITNNRFRFSYGRKPKRNRFTNLDIPQKEDIPEWVYRLKITKDIYSKSINQKNIEFDTKKWKYFKLNEIFNIKKGKRLTKENFIEGMTPFISAIDSNNGYRDFIGQEPIHKENTITVNYNGSVGESFYQPKPFWASDDVNILYSKFELNKYIAMFLITIIKLEKYRFNYGRKWETNRMNESQIKLPANEKGNPDWKFMEEYIKSLPYSSSL